jgi:hypothetical protein
MSHFTVLVVGPDPEEQLAPFQENNMGDCPKELLEFNDTEDEMLDEYENESTIKVKSPEGKMFWCWDEQFKDPKKPFSKEKNYPDGYAEVEVPFKELYVTFEKFVEDYHGYESRDKHKRRYGYWENPNAKWDWYLLGGRWTGMFKIKEDGWGNVGEPGIMTEPAEDGWVDQAYKSDIDWDAVREKSIKDAEKTWEEYQADTKQTPEQKEFWYGIKKDETKEQYLARRANFSVFAVIKEGKWFEKGEMGWWGIVSDKKDPNTWSRMVQELLNEVPDDTLLSVFDCHI